MYNSSVDFVVKSIQKTSLVNLNGLIYQEYQDFFDDVWLEKIKNSHHLYNFDQLETQENKPRKKLSYQSMLAKELKILFSHNRITQALEKIYQTELKFSSCDLWQDFQGYFLQPHTDDTRIKLAIQIYVGESDTVGTKFFSSTISTITEIDVWKQEYLQHEIKEIIYKKNHGYSLLNNNYSWHGVCPNIKDDRLSVYVRYF
jgi:hypothetical protein